MVQVRDSAAWTIGRVCERCPTAFLNENYILPLLQVLVNGLSTEPRVAINVCWVGRLWSSVSANTVSNKCSPLILSNNAHLGHFLFG